MLVEEIRERFMNMKIGLENLNSKVDLSSSSKSGELILRTCICGAFYDKFVKASYKRLDKDLSCHYKPFNYVMETDYANTLVFNKLNRNLVTEYLLENFFKEKYEVRVS